MSSKRRCVLAPWKAQVEASVASHCGRRRHMEDAHVVVSPSEFGELLLGQAPEGLRIALFAVLDGHNGREAADVAAEALPREIASELLASRAWHRRKDVTRALRRACENVERACSTKTNSGCCCVAALVVQDECHIVNIGDSRAVLVRRGEAGEPLGDDDVGGPPGVSARHKFPWDFGGPRPRAARALGLTVDHRPTLERERIEAAGAEVDGGRVGGLGVSRSFGDAKIKETARGALVADPDLRVVVALDPEKDEFIFLACDGLFEAFSNKTAAQFVRARLLADVSYAGAKPHQWPTPSSVVKALVDDAVQNKHATDNVSVILIRISPRDRPDDLASSSSSTSGRRSSPPPPPPPP
ncbi:hypothetical protein CTAYLR_002494 [Chrysophaeum taylorii]|uniref:PPM-type phosphatase domain-containing protein n=1 Tax=Chrysophaeum taylorii TaxID=2483200 RepID=A0AAD7XML7_9STRA|nr:hypothetical protein CTAYLR_002494 [Chrysophaeum taylorii]